MRINWYCIENKSGSFEISLSTCEIPLSTCEIPSGSCRLSERSIRRAVCQVTGREILTEPHNSYKNSSRIMLRE